MPQAAGSAYDARASLCSRVVAPALDYRKIGWERRSAFELADGDVARKQIFAGRGFE